MNKNPDSRNSNRYRVNVTVERTVTKFTPYNIIIPITSLAEQAAIYAMSQYSITIPNACSLNHAEERIVSATLQSINRAITDELDAHSGRSPSTSP